jgi:hypothetical protein
VRVYDFLDGKCGPSSKWWDVSSKLPARAGVGSPILTWLPFCSPTFQSFIFEKRHFYLRYLYREFHYDISIYTYICVCVCVCVCALYPELFYSLPFFFFLNLLLRTKNIQSLTKFRQKCLFLIMPPPFFL